MTGRSVGRHPEWRRGAIAAQVAAVALGWGSAAPGAEVVGAESVPAPVSGGAPGTTSPGGDRQTGVTASAAPAPGSAAPAPGSTAPAPGSAAPAPGSAVPAPASAAPASDPPPSPALAEADDGDGPVRLSLATEDDVALWRKPGFRLSLGFAGGVLEGLGGPPSGTLLGPVLRVGARTSEDWSLLATFAYTADLGFGGLYGLRYAGTLDPTWHLTDNLELSVGLGFGGFVEGTTGREDPDAALRASLDTSYTLTSADPPLPRCQGIGPAALVRAGWMILLGPRSSTGLTVQADAQYTVCIDDTGRVEPDTARPIERRQWWRHIGGSAAWIFTWR